MSLVLAWDSESSVVDLAKNVTDDLFFFSVRFSDRVGSSQVQVPLFHATSARRKAIRPITTE
jgi:hypothetical protein